MFCISDSFMYDCVVSSLEKLLKFNRIECLVLKNIELKCLKKLLNQLHSLSHLSSLVISGDSVKNKGQIYQQIFSLRTLRYCQLSLSERGRSISLPIAINEYSPIEHLIITNSIKLHEFDSIISCVPQLRRLSLNLSATYQKFRSAQRCPFVLKKLTHISLQLCNSIKFNLFEEIFRELFPMIEVLHLTVSSYFDQLYANAHKWEQLITSHLSYLRIFDIYYYLPATSDIFPLSTDVLINQFTTPFWIARQWSFIRQMYSNTSRTYDRFYSANPYRYPLTYRKFLNIYFFDILEENITDYLANQ